MEVFYYIFALGLCLGSTVGVPLGNATTHTGKNGTDTDKRINLNINQGNAFAMGPQGSFSASQGTSFGFKADILYPGGWRKNLANHASSQSNTITGGRAPPSTSVDTGTFVGGGRTKGYANAGYKGGQGKVSTSSKTSQIAIQLGGGAVLLNNFPTNQTQPIEQDGKKIPPKEVAEAPSPSKKAEEPTVPTAPFAPHRENQTDRFLIYT